MQDKFFTKLMTIPQAAAALRVSRRTVCYRIKSGQLPYCKLGHSVRIMPEDLKEYVLARRVGGK